VLIASCFLVSIGASEARDIWSKGDIAGLFPPAPDGWRVSSLDFEAIETPLNELEKLANALNENFDTEPHLRLKAVRRYILNEQKVTVTIETDNIDAAINIDVMTAAFASGDEATRTRLESDGFSIITRHEYPGVALRSKDQSGLAFKIGSTGVIGLECSYFDCNDILDLLTEQIDFNAVADFVAFEHRPQDP